MEVRLTRQTRGVSQEGTALLEDRLSKMRDQMPLFRCRVADMAKRLSEIDHCYWDSGEDLSGILDRILLAEDQVSMIETQLSVIAKQYPKADRSDRNAATVELRYFSLESLLSIIETRLEQAERNVRSQRLRSGPASDVDVPLGQ